MPTSSSAPTSMTPCPTKFGSPSSRPASTGAAAGRTAAPKASCERLERRRPRSAGPRSGAPGQPPTSSPAPGTCPSTFRNSSPAASPEARVSTRGAVAAGHPLTAEAGAAVLRKGGNAVDAAVAAVLASFAVESPLTGFGAGGYMMVHDAGGETTLTDFFVAAPGLD